MAAGDVTQGRRRGDDTSPLDLMTADYCLRDGHLWVVLPSGVGPSRLEGWEVTEHEDGTITACPSIHDAPDGWHGHLEHGVWREV